MAHCRQKNLFLLLFHSFCYFVSRQVTEIWPTSSFSSSISPETAWVELAEFLTHHHCLGSLGCCCVTLFSSMGQPERCQLKQAWCYLLSALDCTQTVQATGMQRIYLTWSTTSIYIYICFVWVEMPWPSCKPFGRRVNHEKSASIFSAEYLRRNLDQHCTWTSGSTFRSSCFSKHAGLRYLSQLMSSQQKLDHPNQLATVNTFI